MIATDEDALICDLAETYHIFDYKALPVPLLTTLSVGLRDDSRIKTKMDGRKVSIDIMLLAAITDRLSLLLWTQTVDGQKGINRPWSILDVLERVDQKKVSDIIAYETGEEFEKARAEIIRKSEEE